MSTRQQTGFITGVGTHANARLFRALAEDLRLPLMQIARESELARMLKNLNSLKTTEATAAAALKLIDSYIFSTQVLLGQQTLELEPVSPRAVMYDTAQYLHEIAKLYEYKIELDISRSCKLIMAHPKGLQAALSSLAYSFMTGFTSQQNDKIQKITLTARRAGYGVAAGVMVSGRKISQSGLNRARSTFGDVRQPLAQTAHTSAAGIYVADSLFAAMASELKVKSARGSAGLAAMLWPSQQLTLL